MSETHLTEVRRLNEARQLRLTWSDGHSAEFEARYLRGFCPCAGCQGHSAAAVEYREPPSPVRVSSIQPVGRYAISLAFTDGHNTGIYRFDFLRLICPCPEHLGAREGLHASVRLV